MLTKLKRKFKKIAGKKIIFPNAIYDINLDAKFFDIFGVKIFFRKKLFRQNFNNLSLLFQTDKAPFMHNVTLSVKDQKYIRTINQSHDYAKFYDAFFFKIKNKIRNVCEIGVMSGASTAAFYFFFPKSKIFACDINFQRFNIFSKRIKKVYLDQSNQNEINKFKSKFNKVKYDIIIDDGSHIDDHIILTFNNLIERVSKGGFYIIEDASKELTPKTMRLINNRLFKKKFGISKIWIFKSEEGAQLFKFDGTKQNYIIFIKKD